MRKYALMMRLSVLFLFFLLVVSVVFSQYVSANGGVIILAVAFIALSVTTYGFVMIAINGHGSAPFSTLLKMK